jgi:hypothetical protein
MEILTFVIEGWGEIKGDGIPTVLAKRAGSVDDEELKRREPSDFHAVELLNRRADEMAQNIEREVRRLMPLGGGISVQADISFHSGSIILEGSVVLLCWAARTALEPIRDELANAIKTVTRRVVNRAVTTLGAGSLPGLGQMTVEVASVSSPPTTPAVISSAASSEVPQAPPSSLVQSGIPQDQRWMFAFVGILTVLVLILLADRLLTPSLLRNDSITRAAVPESPSAPQGAASGQKKTGE